MGIVICFELPHSIIGSVKLLFYAGSLFLFFVFTVLHYFYLFISELRPDTYTPFNFFSSFQLRCASERVQQMKPQLRWGLPTPP